MKSIEQLTSKMELISGQMCLILVALVASQSIMTTSAPVSIEEVCKSKLEFNKLSEFRAFYEEFKQLNLENIDSMDLDSRCKRQLRSIIDLESIVSVTNKVCDSEHIDRMVDYHDRYLLKSHAITAQFFKLYAVQVSYTCKMNIKKNLSAAQSEMQQLTKVLTQARNAISNDSNLKTNLQMISSQTNEPASANVKPKTREELVMDEFRDLLTQSARVEDVLAYKQQDCLKASKEKAHPSISKRKLDVFMKSALICHRLSRYYSGSILSLARLANHGYTAKIDKLDEELAQSRHFKDWLIAVQICEPLTHIKAHVKEGDPDSYVLDTCATYEMAEVSEPMVFEDSFDEIGDDIPLLAKLSDSSKDAAKKKWRSASRSIMKLKVKKTLKEKKSLKSKIGSIKSLRKSLGNDIYNVGSDDDDDGYSDEDMEASYLSRLDTSVFEDEETASIASMKAIQALMPTYESLTDNEVFPDEKEVRFGFDPVSYFTSLAIITAVMLAVEWIFLIALTLMARLESDVELSDVLRFPPKFPSLKPHTNFERVLHEYDDLDEDELIRYDELTETEKMHQRKLRKIFGRTPPAKFR